MKNFNEIQIERLVNGKFKLNLLKDGKIVKIGIKINKNGNTLTLSFDVRREDI